MGPPNPPGKPTLLTLVLLALLILPGSAGAVSGNIPLSSPVYEILDYLTANGYLNTYLSGTRPITFGEGYRLLEEAREAMGRREILNDRGRQAVVGAFTRLEFLILQSLRGGTGLFPVRDLEAGIDYLNGEPSPIPGINAAQHALVYNNEGIDPDEGSTGIVVLGSEAIFPHLNVRLHSRLTTGEEDRAFIHKGYAKTRILGLELGVGKESLWWGQGRHGGLFLTGNAEPLPMVRLTNPSPASLPFIFKYLGPCRMDFFLSRLEEDRAQPEPWLAGFRLDFRPFRSLEAGMTMMVMAGGEGRPEVDLGDLFGIFFGENESGDEDRSNRVAGFDFRLTLPGWQVYGEFGGEDEAGFFPSKWAGLMGVYIPSLGPSMDLRVEFADLAYNEEIGGAWYTHGAYTDGYTYKGRILGHHVGGDGRDLFAEISLDLGLRSRARMGVDLEWRGLRNQEATEEHVQFLAGYEGAIGGEKSLWRGAVEGSVDLVTNAGYVEGEERKDYQVGARVWWGR